MSGGYGCRGESETSHLAFFDIGAFYGVGAFRRDIPFRNSRSMLLF